MRLNEKQVQAIKTALTVSYGSDAEVWLFGSRTDDALRGGELIYLFEMHLKERMVLNAKLNFRWKWKSGWVNGALMWL